MKKTLALIALGVALLAGWLYLRESAPPEVPFARVERETLVSTLATNGKVEPLEWASIRAERPGSVERVPVEKGQRVAAGAVVAQLDSREARANLASAEARIAQARAELDTFERGGRQAELAEIDSSLERAALELEQARREAAALDRLVKKEAATAQELAVARDRVRKAEVEIESLRKKRAALVTKSDRTAAEARLREAEAEAALARDRIAGSVIRSPMAGVLYQLEVRPGAYLQPGDLVAEVGRLDRLRVIVYVDEPELGRVAIGLPVTITWDAMPERQWKGVVEKLPTRIVALGTRQVGEVICTIENPEQDLLPGTNVNAEIRSQMVEGALTIPKAAIRRENGKVGVYGLENGRLTWRDVKLGVSGVTRTQVVEGLAEGDAVAMPTDIALPVGRPVTPVF